MEKEIGKLKRYEKNEKNMMRVIRKNRREENGESKGYEGIEVNKVELIDEDWKDKEIIENESEEWEKEMEIGEKKG